MATFNVLLGNKDRVDAALSTLAKRAARKGIIPTRWVWGKAYTERVESVGQVARIPLTLEGDAPHYDGWTFVAALGHLDGKNIVRAVEGSEVPAEYRTRGPMCDHCQQLRRRNDTYVLRHDDGRYVQVGSTCIGDFLGSYDASNLAAQASMLSEARGLAEGGCEGFGSGSGALTLEQYLPYVAACVRTFGWTSRTTVRESGTGRATADDALLYATNLEECRKAGCEPSADDAVAAVAAEQWAENLTDEQINAEKGDYLHNLRAIARSGVVSHKSAGLTGSMVVAHQRAISRARERAERTARPQLNEHIGTLKKRETWSVVLDFVTGYATDYGYTTVLKFRTAEGVCIVWKATSTEITRADVGKAYNLTGTVKKHDEYKGAKQTIVTRCKLEAVGGQEVDG
jgi:hypothetical protein